MELTASPRGTDADWLLTGGAVWTGAGGPPGGATRDHGVALRKGRVLAVGPSRELDGLRGPGTRVVELGGRFVAPGFVDAHVHLLVGGLALSRVGLRGVRSPEEFVGRVAARARELPPGSWILGGDWNEEEWGGELPSRHWLDRAAPAHPVLLLRADLHTAVAGSTALAMAGLDRPALDPESGIVERDPDTGEPTGILREMALVPVARLVPKPTDEERRSGLQAAFRVALAAGITQVHDMGGVQNPDQSWTSLELLRDLRAGGELPLRVLSALPLAHHERIATLATEEGRGDHFLGWGMAKGFVDGSLGSATAWFREPYLGDPGNVGTPITDLDELRECLRGALDAGLHAAVHAIGDRAVDWIFDAWEELGSPSAPCPFRVEHAQHLSPEALPRTALPGMILSVQPYHLVWDAPVVDERLGPDRAARTFALRSMQEAGARLAFGSDWPVVPMDPLGALHAAVTRVPGRSDRTTRDPAPTPWQPGERLSTEPALRAHTEGAAAAGPWGRETGILEAGRRGDLVVLSKDPFRLDPQEWREVLQVEMTFVEGAPAFGVEGSPTSQES
jgi:predicted amidohydrolase YtcJ